MGITAFSSIPEGKYFDGNLKNLVNTKKASVIEVGKELKLDKDTLIIRRVINTEDKTYVRYTMIRKINLWSFSDNNIKIFDDKGKELHKSGGTGNGKLWGQEGLFYMDRIPNDVKYLVIKLDIYDRHDEVKIPLGEVGEGNGSN